MFGRFVRYLLAICLAIILTLPQATAAWSALGLADGRVMVICTGDGLRTVTLDAEGKPIEVSAETELCALVNVVDTSRVLTPVSLQRSGFDLVLSCNLAAPCKAPHSCTFSHSRAPPVV